MVSNKTLALIIVTTMIVSLGGTLMSLNKLQQIEELRKIASHPKYTTGYVEYGNVTFTVSSSTACVVNSNVTFGSFFAGNITSPITLSTLLDNSALGLVGATNCGASQCGMEINNTGSTVLLINITSNANATTLLASTTAIPDGNFTIEALNGSNTGVNPGCVLSLNNSWYNVTGNMTGMCAQLGWNPGNDTIHLAFNVTINGTTTPGTKAAKLTVTCI